MSFPERLILIHGAWAGAWVWTPLQDELARLGYESCALDLPGDGAHPISADSAQATDFRDCLAEAIARGPTPVALIGHSGGGMLVTAGAEWFPDAVSHGIWVAGMLLSNGQSFDDIQKTVAGDAGFGVTPHIVSSADGRTNTVPPDAAVRYFFQDVPAKTAAEAAARLTAQPVAGHRMACQTGPHFAQMPKLYITATEDRSVIPQAQRMMCADVPNLDVAEISAGHVPQISQPGRTAGIINDWLTRTEKSTGASSLEKDKA